MSRTTMILLMLAVTAAATARAAYTASRIAATKQSPLDWRVALIGAPLLMQLILLMNAMAFVGWAEIAAAELGRSSVLEDQLWLLGGTGGLMLLTAAALDDPAVRSAPDPATAAGRAYTVMVERLLVRFWWAALGLGLIFGVRARGVALLLAVELTLVWGIGRLTLLLRAGRGAGAGRAAGRSANPPGEEAG